MRRGNNTFSFQLFTIQQSHAAMRVGTDSVLLGALAKGGKEILDIGTGTGVLTLMMAQRHPLSQLTAIDIDDAAIIDARYNISHSIFRHRINLHHMSFQDYCLTNARAQKPPFDSIVCNPPYFVHSLTCNSISKTRARHTASLPFATLITGVSQLLERGGFFTLSIPSDAITDISMLCSNNDLYIHHQYAIHTVATHAPKRFILSFCKGIPCIPQKENCYLYDDNHHYTPWYIELMQPFLTHLPK